MCSYAKKRATISTTICTLCLLLSSSTTVAYQNTTASSYISNGNTEHIRMPLARRLYGEHTAKFRQHIHNSLERKQRFQTGIPTDPNHIIQYRDHPFERRLTSSNNTSGSNFKPMRIKFVTTALDSIADDTNSDKIKWFKEVILPKTASFWSQALSVIPVEGYLRISAAELDERQYCGDTAFTKVPDEHISKGVTDTDLLLYVSGSPSTLFCPDRTLAVAVPCNFDQFDRPIAGSINVCLNAITLNSDGTASDSLTGDYVDVTIHEVTHVLGHSSNSYRFYWDADTGQPRTKRPFSVQTVTCVGGETQTLALPDENTLVFVKSQLGLRYASIVTPKVRTVARNQFDCPTLEGARLEQQPTRVDSCTGDHWDERLFYPEALTPVISPTTNIMSSLTLALMEDSGWYRANYTMSRMNPWGLGAGCEFVEGACLFPSNSSGDPTIPSYGLGYFCNKEDERACSPELSTKMACTVIDYDYFVPQELPPSEFVYFVNAPSKGGPRQGNWCPVYGTTYDGRDASELDCTDAANGGSTFNIHSEVYGSDSKCIPSSSGEGRCYRTACVQDTMTLQINVGGKWFTCEHDFQKIVIDVTLAYPQTLTCPRLSQACPDLFCPFMCAGRGVCNYENTVNGTVIPKCECFDSSDTSPSCSDSLIPNGEFLKDSSGLVNNLEQGFFDPLVAVFVDNPDTWSTASWAWAAGLVTVCLVLFLCICSSFMPQKKVYKYR